MSTIPKIIHQIWSGIDESLPECYKLFGETWKKHHPRWKYEIWDDKRMNSFINQYYPQYWEAYQNFPYNIQRWDAIRYLILYKIGGMYVDFDTECLRPHDELLAGKNCCFSMEPEEHKDNFNLTIFFNNALIASIPEHPFMKKIIETVFSYTPKEGNLSEEQRFMEILNSTGPLALTDIYNKYPEKEQIYLIHSKHVSPFDYSISRLIRQGCESKEFDNRLADAYSVHYFFGDWKYVN